MELQARDSISPLPKEIICSIVYMLPSLPEVFAFAALNTRIRTICQDDFHIIFEKIAPRNIDCLSRAQQLLADQDGPPITSKMTLGDGQGLFNNCQEVERALFWFEKVMFRRVRCFFWDTQKIYGMDGHPPFLTATERIRFIRAYYDLWSLMLIPDEEKVSRLKATCTMKQLYYLMEFMQIRQNVGGVEELTGLDLKRKQYFERSLKRKSACESIVRSFREVYTEFHGFEGESTSCYALDDGRYPYLAIWDFWQEPFKTIVCGARQVDSRPVTPGREHFWDYETDEEVEG